MEILGKGSSGRPRVLGKEEKKPLIFKIPSKPGKLALSVEIFKFMPTESISSKGMVLSIVLEKFMKSLKEKAS